jgi:HEAT repeat protein
LTLFGPDIKKMESKKDVDGLLKAFMKNEEIGDKEEAIHQALIRIGEPSVKPLVEALAEGAKQAGGENATIDRFILHWDAVEILKKMPASQHRPLIALIKSGDTGVRCQAIGLTGDIGYKEASDALIEALFDPEVQAAAALAQESIQDKRAINGLLRVIEHGNDLARKNAASALGKFQLREHIPILIKLLDDKAAGPRYSAVYWLGETKDRTLLPVIARLLDDTDAFVRGAAAEAIGKLDGTEYFGRLAKLIDDSEKEVRKMAAEALGRLDREKARSLLSDAAGYQFGRTGDQRYKWFGWKTALMFIAFSTLFSLRLLQVLSESISRVPSQYLYLNYSLFFIILFAIMYSIFYFPVFYKFKYQFRFDVAIIFTKLDFDEGIMLDSLERRLKESYQGEKGGKSLDAIKINVRIDGKTAQHITIKPGSSVDRTDVEITRFKQLDEADQKRLLSIITDAAIESFLTPSEDG